MDLQEEYYLVLRLVHLKDLDHNLVLILTLNHLLNRLDVLLVYLVLDLDHHHLKETNRNHFHQHHRLLM
jgi:hypothetical protein